MSTIYLNHGGREYWVPNIDGLPVDVTSVSADFETGTWHTLAPVNTAEGVRLGILIAHPAATDNPTGTVVITGPRCVPTVRIEDTPEVVVRRAGLIIVRP